MHQTHPRRKRPAPRIALLRSAARAVRLSRMSQTALSRRRPSRALLLTLVAIGALLVLIAIAAWIGRDRIYQSFLDPGVPYQTYQAPPAPDYAEDAAWGRRPALDPQDPDTPAVFFVHNTTYDGGEHWNAPFDRPQEAEEIARIVLPNFAGPFEATGAVFAPRYRQASLYAFMNNREDSQRARRTAAHDVSRAFERFRAEIGEERPFLVVGVGQGALHALKVLLDQVAPDEALSGRLAAAYLLEGPAPLDLFEGPLSNLPPCTQAVDVRCVVSYAPARANERERIEALTDRSMSWTADGRLAYVDDRALLCVNPLLWTTTEDFAPARLHRGGAAAEDLDPGDSPSPLSAQTGAQCRDGVLMIEEPRSDVLRRPNRLAEHRRAPPYNLFYSDLQANAAARLAALAGVLAEERRWAPELAPPETVEVAPVEPVDPPR